MHSTMKPITVKKAICCQRLMHFEAIVLPVGAWQLGQISIHVWNGQGEYLYQIWSLETIAGPPARSGNYEQQLFIMVSSNNGALLPTHNSTNGGSHLGIQHYEVWEGVDSMWLKVGRYRDSLPFCGTQDAALWGVERRTLLWGNYFDVAQNTPQEICTWLPTFAGILQGHITGTGTIIWLHQCQWCNLEE